MDTQYPQTAEACWTGLQERSALDRLSAVINTHHHGDHTGGNGTFEPHTDMILGHANVPELLRSSADEDDDAPVVPNETYDGELTKMVGSQTMTLTHYGPAHTAGDSVIHFEDANVVHMGDLVFNRAYPFIDAYGGGADTENWITTLETVHDAFTDETVFIHGHGNPEFGITGSRADLLAMRDFLTALREYVTTQMQAGASLEEMKQKDGLDGFEDWQFDWAISLSRCIDAVYKEMNA